MPKPIFHSVADAFTIVGADAQSTFAIPPAAAVEADVTSWRTNGRLYSEVDVELSAAGAADITNAALYAEVNSVWSRLGSMGEAADGAVSLTAVEGWVERWKVPARATKLAIKCDTTAAFSWRATPVVEV